MHIKLHDYIYGFIIAHMDLINAYDTKMIYLVSDNVCPIMAPSPELYPCSLPTL